MNKSPEQTPSGNLIRRIADTAAPFAYAEAAIFLFFSGNIPLAMVFAGIGRVLQGLGEDPSQRNALQSPKSDSKS